MATATAPPNSPSDRIQHPLERLRGTIRRYVGLEGALAVGLFLFSWFWIDLALDYVNAQLEDELPRPIEIGIGIHAGPLLLGRIGWGESVDMTVIGHTVNAASRLEALTKEKKCQIVISRDVAQYAGLAVPDEGEAIQVRGIAEKIQIVPIKRGRDLPPHILNESWTG